MLGPLATFQHCLGIIALIFQPAVSDTALQTRHRQASVGFVQRVANPSSVLPPGTRNQVDPGISNPVKEV